MKFPFLDVILQGFLCNFRKARENMPFFVALSLSPCRPVTPGKARNARTPPQRQNATTTPERCTKKPGIFSRVNLLFCYYLHHVHTRQAFREVDNSRLLYCFIARLHGLFCWFVCASIASVQFYAALVNGENMTP